MTISNDLLVRLRRIYVDGVRDWDTDYERYIADVEKRIGCLTVELGKLTGRPVSMETPTGDVHYYALEVPLRAPPGRFRVGADDIDASGVELLYLVAYCSSIVPVVEFRWHAITRDREHALTRRSFDVLDDAWLATHPREEELALKVVEAAEGCGWQVAGPALMEQRAPKDWPFPLPSYDYQNGDYLVRDYVVKGMRDY